MLIRSESRVIRPYNGLEASQSILSNVRISIDNALYENGTITMPESRLASATVQLETGTNIKELRKACDAAGVPYKSAKFIVLGRSRMLRRSSLVYEHVISDSNFEESIEIDRLVEDRFVFKDKTGFHLTAAITLSENIKNSSLKVSKSGTWLGSSHFKIKPQESNSSFSPLPLNKAIREKYGLKVGTYSYIEIQDDLVLLDDLSSGITAYLDEDVLNLLLRDEKDSVSEALQTQFAIQTLYSICKEISNEMSQKQIDTSDLGSESAALHFIHKLSSEFKLDSNQLLEIANNDSSMLLSLFESNFAFAKKIEKLLKDN